MARLTLTAGESVGLSSGNYTIYGTTSGAETVTVAAGTTVTFDASFNRGGDAVTLSGNASAYTAVRSGSSVVLTDSSGGVVTIPVGTTALTVKFADVTAGRSLVYDTTAASISLGGQTVTTTSAAVTAGSGGSSTDAARTMTLTTGLNTGSGFTGGSGDDTFDGSTSNSLNTGDVLVGGAGTDTLSATLNGTTAAPNISGVEVVNLTVSTSAATVSAANVTGVTTINNVGSTAGLTVTNLSTVPTTLGVNTNAVGTTLKFTTAALAGDSDEIGINLDGVSAGSSVTLSVVSGASGSLETVSVVTGSVANVLDTLSTDGVEAATIVISGDQDLTVTNALGDYVETVSAGSATGNLKLSTSAYDTTVTSGSGNDTITSGAGNDVITSGSGVDSITSGAGNDHISAGDGADTIVFATANLTSLDTLSGGSGTDTLKITDAAATLGDSQFANASSIETVTVSAATTATITFNGNADAAGVATFTDFAGDALNLTVGSAFDNALTINIKDGDDTVVASSSNAAVTISSQAANITVADKLIGGAGSSDDIRLTSGAATQTAAFGNVSGFETITLVASSDNDFVLTMNDNQIVGSNSITVDASGLTNSSSTLTLTSGEANVNATLVVIGGAGNDTITGASEKADFRGGDGLDVFTFATADLKANDTLSGGSGTDTLKITDAAATLGDSQFANASSIETVTVSAATTATITFNGNADAAGVATFTDFAGDALNLTVGSAFDNALTINIKDGDDTVVASSSNAAVTISSQAANITVADKLIGGAGSSDDIRLTSGAATQTAAFGNVSGFETITLVASSDNDFVLTMNDNQIVGSNSITVDASGLTNSSSTLTLTSGEANVNATLVVIGGAGNDTITGASEKADFRGGDGLDVFTFATADLKANDTLSGGSGTDTLKITDAAATLGDSQFANASSIETVTVSAATTATITFNGNADAAGVATFTDFAGDALNLTVGSAFDNALTINIKDGDDTVTAAASGAAVTIASTAANFTSADVLTGGTGSGDTLRITADNGTAALAGVSEFEVITIVAGNSNSTGVDADNSVTITTADGLLDRSDSITIDASALANSSAKLTFTSSEATDYLTTINVIGGNGADTMTGGVEQSNFSGGAGNDVFAFTAANLDAYDTVDGGTGTTDMLKVTGTIVDADFSNIRNIDVLTDTSAVAVTLGAYADASGLSTVTGTSSADSVRVGAGFDNALYVSIDGGADVVNASGSNAVLTVAAAAAGSITTADTLIGGGTSGDVIRITGGLTSTFGGNVSGFETITVVNDAGDDTTTITTHDNQVAAGATLVVNASAESNTADALNFTGSAELDGSFSITGAAGGDVIVGGLQADTVSGGTGADSISGGGGADVLTGGAGADTIVGGVAADTISLTETTSAADVVEYTTNVFSEGGDTITGFVSGTDKIKFDATTLGDGTADSATLKSIAVNGTVAENDEFVEITTSLSGSLTNADTVASNLSALTLTTIATSEKLVFAVTDGTDTYLWLYNESGGSSGIQASELTYIAKLVGVADVANGDFLGD